MSPSGSHEGIKSIIGRLVEVWCLERGIEFSTMGSWTLKDKTADRGVEPDECYIFGTRRGALRPDLAIEVIWTSGGINKLEIYRKLGVAEVWIWRRGELTPYVLRGDSYEAATQSAALPGIDLRQLASFLDQPTTSAAIRAYRDLLRKE
jgi:Uma2 family endonuclease